MKTSKNSLKKTIGIYQDLVSLKCLDCVCCQPKEILKCNVSTCPLWNNRPKKLEGVYKLANRLKKKNSENFEAKN